MTEVLHFPPPQTANNSSSGDVDEPTLSCAPQTSLTCAHGDPVGGGGEVKKRDKQEGDQLSLLALLVTFFRKSLTACRSSSDNRTELCATMDIGCPTDVRHVAHVTFDRFHGFLGLPVEFEPEVPRRAPSASATVFGVSTESMQLSYDTRGNSVPTILLLMQRRLYAQAGLQAEGIFRINGENSLEEYVREQLNGGVVPEGIDAHCLAGLIKAWFRELPSGVLDSLNSEQVMQCLTEEQCAELVRLLPPTEYALLDWAINLMADVVQQEHLNKMNARNIAMVFAPNMTQMADPLTALMYAVQVMNFLKTLILRTLREREDSAVETTQASFLEPFDDDGDQRPSISCNRDAEKDNQEIEPAPPGFRNYSQNNETADGEGHGLIPSVGKRITDEDHDEETPPPIEAFISEKDATVTNDPNPGTLTYAGQSSDSSPGKVTSKITGQQSTVEITNPVDKTEGIRNLSRIDSRVERIEAWR